MNPADIKTRRQLTAYLYKQLSTGAWGAHMLPNLDAPEHWTDEPVSELEVGAAILEWRRQAQR
ncbi:MAG TPA: hypothetical protein VKB34_09550 [Povalibacter sp.]|nr:hypothetical protein [Povalibacter sp.]